MSQALIEDFYAAFGRADGAAMAACYAPGARFDDPVFKKLRGDEPGAMWRMLTSEARELEVACHLAADRHGHAAARCGLDGAGHEGQHRRMQRVVQVGHGIVGPVDGERVLDQVVGADREEIQPAHEDRQRERCGRDLDHAADLDRLVVGLVALVELLLRLADEGEGLLDLVHVREHRQENAHLAVVRCAQDRAQLGQEQPRLGETEANGAQAQRGIRRDARKAVEPFERLVRAEVEGANGDGSPLHPLGHRAVRLELLVLGRQAVAVEEQELGAEQADAGGAVVERLREVLGQLDVRVELDVHAVEGLGGLRAQAL